MYERMLNKQVVPTIEEMAEYCAENAERFSVINDWLTTAFHAEQKVVFPYGNKYGRGIGHYKNIDNKYPCGDGGWIHYRVICQEHFEDIKKLLEIKCQ